MRFGTKILLLTLLLTVGTSALLTWVVTINITRYETRRCDDRISQAIAAYVSHLEDRHHQIDKIVRVLLEASVARSQLQELDDSTNTAAREQFRQEILGRTVQTELQSPEGSPAFHVLVNQAGEVVLNVAPNDKPLEHDLATSQIHWPIDRTLNPDQISVNYYVSLPTGLFLAMGIPLRTQLDEAPSHAYFVGFRVNDDWIDRQLLSQRAEMMSTDAPLAAWFVTGNKITAKASSARADARIQSLHPETPIHAIALAAQSASPALGPAQSIEFRIAAQHYVGQQFQLNPSSDSPGRLILASSLDEALLPLRDLQIQILIFSTAICLSAIFLCRWLARRLARPVQQLVVGTQQIAAGNFDHPVQLHRNDELGQLGTALNQMAGGLKERDTLRDERTKAERELAVARKIQMDVLPREIPPCPGYEIATYSLPAEQTGGDIFDIVPLQSAEPASPLVLLLADATGHGIGAALSVTQVRAMLRIGVRLRAGLDSLIAQINRQLCEDFNSNRFVTAFLGLLDPTLHTINYYSAGQGPLLHFHAADQTISSFNATMLPLGVEEEGDNPPIAQIPMHPGDLFIVLTDGFYEYQNAAHTQFTPKRVEEIIRANHTKTPNEILQHLISATQTFAAGAPQLDDMTAIIIKRI